MCILNLNFSLFAQASQNNSYTFWNSEMQAIANPISIPGWITFKESLATPVTQIFTQHSSAFGLTSNDSMGLIKQETDNLGWTHYWFRQYHNGILVQHGEFNLHSKGNKLYGTGIIRVGLSSSGSINYTYTNALSIIQSDIIDSIIHDVDEGLLIENYTGNDRICFVAKVFTADESKKYFVNADNGFIEYIEEGHANYQVEHAHGYQTFCRADSVSIAPTIIDTIYSTVNGGPIFYDTAQHYFLVDTGRGNGIETYGIKRVFPPGAPDYVTTDLFYIDGHDPYGNSCNHYLENYLNAATNAYWTTQNVYDYLSEYFGYNSINNNGVKLSLLGDASPSFSNGGASYNFIPEISASGVRFGIEFSNPAIISHEWGHGLNSPPFGPNLGGLGESGMLSEGFSDIFGIVMQSYMNDKYNLGIDDPDWLGNTEYGIDKRYNRSKANPKGHGTGYPVTGVTGLVYFDHPDFYQGQNWEGVGFQNNNGDLTHHNSTVFSHWFYLISEGGLKTNEMGDSYDLYGMGIHPAFEIVMRAVRSGTLTSGSDFLAMRRATIQATLDLYGPCIALEDVINAWDAVGVYDPAFNGFYSPNIYVNATVSNNTSFTDTMFIVGSFDITNNSIVNMNSTTVYLSALSDISVEFGSELNLQFSTFYCGKASFISIESGGDFFSNQSSFEYKDTICLTPNLQPLWLGINFESSNTSFFEFTENSLKDAWCGVFIEQQNGNTQLFNISGNDFEENAKSIQVEGNEVFAISSSKNNIIDNTFKNPWSYNSDVGILIPEILGYQLDVEQHVSVYNLKNTSIQRNFFSIPALQISLVYLNPVNQPVMPISGSQFSNQGPLVVSTKALGLRSNSLDVTFEVDSNTFLRWNNSVWIEEGVGVTTLTKNKYLGDGVIASTQSGYASPLPSVYCSGKLNSSENLYSRTGKGLTLLNSENSLIEGDTFDLVIQNIYIQGGIDNVIKNNQFKNMRSKIDLDGVGIHLYGALSTKIRDNEFSGLSPYGIVADNTGNNDSYLFNNRFGSTINYAVQTDEDNSGLKLKCNTFAADGSPHFIGLFVIDGTLANQGLSCLGTGNNAGKNQAGNEWLDNSTLAQYSMNFDLIIGDSVSPFTYYAHQYEALSGNQTQTTNPRKTNVGLNFNLIVCDGNLYPQQIKNDSSCIDIYDGWHRPATEGILNTELLNQLNDLIIIRNEYLNSIVTLESQLYDPENQHSVVDEIITLQGELAIVNGGIIDIYKTAGNETAAISLLESENTVEAKMDLYHNYIHEEDFMNAARVLNEMVAIYNPSYSFTNQYEYNKNYFADIALLELDLHTEGRKITELNVAEIQMLENIVSANVPVSAKAQVLLGYNGISFFERPIKKLSDQEINDLVYNNQNNFDYQLVVSPNPANQIVDACFNLPANSTNVKLLLIDEYNQVGLLLDENDMNEGENCDHFEVSLYPSGTYRILLEHDNQIATGKHLVILR